MTHSQSSLVDLAKSVGCLAAGLAWIRILRPYVADTPTGVAVLLVPFAPALGAVMYFFARSRRFIGRGDNDV